jgi:cysteinyl-tRNA synthetase
MRALAEKYAAIFFDDARALGVDTGEVIYPRASEYVPQQIDLIQRLENKGFAYPIGDGVYYDTAKFADYGKLGNINLEGQKEGARVEENKEKRNPRDFVLWKRSDKIGWDSPWGKGFPGWHIECTAMIFALLGEQIDIHTGGIEHIPVHHNNEIAQAEAATGKRYVREWLHNAHITLDGKKISKSLGNTVYVSDFAVRGLSPRAFRYWYLTGHYRTPMNFTWEAVAGAAQALKRLTNAYQEMPEGEADKKFLGQFYSAVAHDLDTARGVALVWENVHVLNRATLREVDKILGLGMGESGAIEVPRAITDLVAQREEARAKKDFARADALRAQIDALGYEIKDAATGPQIFKK